MLTQELVTLAREANEQCKAAIEAIALFVDDPFVRSRSLGDYDGYVEIATAATRCLAFGGSVGGTHELHITEQVDYLYKRHTTFWRAEREMPENSPQLLYFQAFNAALMWGIDRLEHILKVPV